MIRYRYVEIGDSIGCEYTFEKAGEYLPSHRHHEELAHSVICEKGSVVLETDGVLISVHEGLEASNWDSSRPHTITAMKDGTVIVNRLYNRPHDAADWLNDSGVL